MRNDDGIGWKSGGNNWALLKRAIHRNILPNQEKLSDEDVEKAMAFFNAVRVFYEEKHKKDRENESPITLVSAMDIFRENVNNMIAAFNAVPQLKQFTGLNEDLDLDALRESYVIQDYLDGIQCDYDDDAQSGQHVTESIVPGKFSHRTSFKAVSPRALCHLYGKVGNNCKRISDSGIYTFP